MKIEIIPLNIDLVDVAFRNATRDQLQYHEYKFINEVQLKQFYVNQIGEALKKVSTISYAAIVNHSVIGIMSVNKNGFDSTIFGHDCYKITDLLVFESKYNIVHSIVSLLIKKLEKTLKDLSKTYHISVGINNNSNNVDALFNSLCNNDFFYFQTLLTFGLEKNTLAIKMAEKHQSINIRVANKNDSSEIEKIALMNMRYSRFHLDPFLDNKLASNLIKNSAKNSIIEGFADIIYVAEVNDEIAGYYSAKKKHLSDINKTVGEVIISIIDSKFRGKGVFSSLDNYILNWFNQNTDFAELGTYLGNYPVHKTWIRKQIPLVRGTHQLSKKY